MATTKKTAGSKALATTPAAQSIDQQIKQAYRTLGFASGINKGDRVQITNHLNVHNIPKGSAAVKSDAYLSGAEGICQGITAAGDLAVRYGGRDYVVPHTLVRKLPTPAATVQLNSRYSAAINNDGTTVTVGCQQFTTAAVQKLAAEITAQQAKIAAAVKAPATLSFVATYKPAASAKKAAKKVPAKKAAR